MNQASPTEAFFSRFSDFMLDGETRLPEHFLNHPQQEKLLAIYRNGFFKSSISGLKANFPSVASLLGDDYFKQIAAAFVQRQAPERVTLVSYGEGFPGFLQQQLTELPYVADFARLDWHWLASLNETDQVPLDTQGFQQLLEEHEDMDQLPLAPLDSLQTVLLDYPAAEVWTQLKQGTLNETVELLPEAQPLVFWKVTGEVKLQELPTGQWRFIDLLIGGTPLTEAAGQAVDADPEFDLGSFFAIMLDNGLLAIKDENR